MKLYFSLAIFINCFFTCAAQSPDKALLKFSSYGGKLFVNRNEQLMIATRAGEVAKSNSIHDYWQMISPEKKKGEGLFGGATIDNVNFFNNDTGFASGFISGAGEKYNIIYHTTDKGRHWKRMDFGQDGWVDDAVNFDNGEAWMSVSGSGIAYTKDYGFTWQALKIPEIKQRFSKIYFNGRHEGFIGSLWNMLAYTDNNCATWKLIPTPLDQKKYTKTNRESRPEINAVAIYKDYYLAEQEDLIFCSRRDSINWVLMPEYSAFYTDAENSALYFNVKKGGFVKADDLLHPIYTYDTKIRSGIGMCRNSSLFIKTETEIMQLKSDNSVAVNFIYTNDPAAVEPAYFGYSGKGTYGYIGNKIFLQKRYTGKWEYQFKLPFSTDSMALTLPDNNTILAVGTNDSLIYYNITTGVVNRKNSRQMLNAFCESNITAIEFETGSSGCFHNYKNMVAYKRSGNSFEKTDDDEVPVQGGGGLPPGKMAINADLVEKFMSELPAVIRGKTKFSDLGFTAADYKACKKNMLAFQQYAEGHATENKSGFEMYENNIDFNRLHALLDSIPFINDDALERDLLQLSNMMSTTTNWTSVSFLNESGQTMCISSNYYKTNAFYFPWMISLEGVRYGGTYTQVTNFIRAAYPKLLSDIDKVAVLQRLMALEY